MKAHQKVFVIINSRIDNEETGQTAMKRKYCFLTSSKSGSEKNIIQIVTWLYDRSTLLFSLVKFLYKEELVIV